jgi:uncharacterized RDD family membrane protein YckC
MSDQGDFTSGDPLGGRGPEAPGYGGGPVPPGAFAPPIPKPDAWNAGASPMVLAEWWRRAVAALIDGSVIAGIAVILFIPLGAIGLSVDTDGGAIAFIFGLIVVAVVVALAALIYQPLMLWRTNGQTVGKMATGIRVIKVDRSPMDIFTAIMREVVLKSVALGILASMTFAIVYLVDWLWPLFDDENRALHDFPMNTRVVRA